MFYKTQVKTVVRFELYLLAVCAIMRTLGSWENRMLPEVTARFAGEIFLRDIIREQ